MIGHRVAVCSHLHSYLLVTALDQHDHRHSGSKERISYMPHIAGYIESWAAVATRVRLVPARIGGMLGVPAPAIPDSGIAGLGQGEFVATG